MLSPDGKYLWTGTEWIPAPPTDSPTPSMINLTDSVIAGDVTINQSVDTEQIISQMKNELERFSNNHTGFHVPAGGFSGAILLQGIQKIESNRSILQSFHNSQLIDFCMALEPFGYSQIIADAATIIIDNGKKSGDLENTAHGHLFKAKSLEDLFKLSESIFHADEAIRIAKLSDNLLIETEGIWASLRVREMTNANIRLYDERIDQLLEKSEEIDYGCYCYLLASKAIFISIEDPQLSEEFEIAAYNSAIQDGDIRLEVYTALELVNNQTHTISKEQLLKLKEKCVINSLTLFANLTDFSIELLDGTPSISIGYKLIETGESLQIPILQVIGELLIHILNLAENISEKDVVIEYLEQENVKSFFDKIMSSKMVSSDTLSIFLMLKIMGVENRLIDRMFRRNPESSNKELELISLIYNLIENRAPPSQIQHMLIIGESDSKDLMDLKKNLNQILSVSALSSGQSFDYTEIDPNNYGTSTSSQIVNSLIMELISSVNNKQWQQALTIVDKILSERNYLTSNRDDMWILGSSLHFQGVSFFHLDEVDKSLKALDESIFWNNKLGEDTSDAQELFDQISNIRSNKTPTDNFASSTPTDNFASLAIEQTDNSLQWGADVCGHCFKRPKTTGVTAHTVRGYLLMVTWGKSWAVGCTTCMRLHLLKETGWNVLFGWWGVKAFIINCIMIPANLISILFVKSDPKQLQQVAMQIRLNSD